MKTIEQILTIIENEEINVYNYKEKGVLCGYELNTYTPCGVNEIIFLDFRSEGKSAINPNDFIEEFENYMKHYTIDERIQNNMQNEKYREDFTLKQSLKDFEKWEKRILNLIKKLKK